VSQRKSQFRIFCVRLKVYAKLSESCYIEYIINVKILSVVCQIRELPDDKLCVVKGNGKSVPLQAWSGPESSRNLRFPHLMTTAQDSGKVVSLTHRPPLTSGNTRGTHFC